MIILRGREIEYCQENINKYKSSDNLLRHARCNKNTEGVMLVDSRGNLVGYVAWEDGWIIALEVSKNYRGLGYGRKLLQRAVEEGCTGLTVDNKNLVAIELYKSEGFKPTFTNGKRTDMELL